MDPHDELVAAVATILRSRVEHFDCEQHPDGHSYLMLRSCEIGGVLGAMHNALVRLEQSRETLGIIKLIAEQFPVGVSPHADTVKLLIAAWEKVPEHMSNTPPSTAIN